MLDRFADVGMDPALGQATHGGIAMNWKRVTEFARQHPLLANLMVLASGYVLAYLADPAAPGGRLAHPLGWFGWFDQGWYLRSAEALSHGNLAASEHHYPILYPALGSLFVRVLPRHPFFPLNLSATLLVAGAFLVVARRYVSWRWATISLWLSVALMPVVYRQFLVPWTSSASAALFTLLILDLHFGTGLPGKTGWKRCFRFALVAFLLAPARPLDAVVSAPLCLLFVYRLLLSSRVEAPPWSFSDYVQRTAAGAAGACIGLGIFLGFNALSSGTLAGSYAEAIGIRAFAFSELPQRVVALLLDGGTIHGHGAESMLGFYPWFIVSLAGMAIMICFGDGLMRAIALTVILQFILYAAYVEILPSGMWKYAHVHFFKWFAPYVVLYPIVAAIFTAGPARSRRVRIGAIGIALAALAASCIGFRAHPVAAEIRWTPPSRLDLANPQRLPVDFIDLRATGAEFPNMYFSGHKLKVAGRPLVAVRDYRVVPTDWGARIVFFHPITEASAALTLNRKARLTLTDPPRAYRYGYGLGIPRWLGRNRNLP